MKMSIWIPNPLRKHGSEMKLFEIVICTIILLCVTGCADTLAGSQNDMASENPSLASEALFSDLSDNSVITDISEKVAPDEDVSEELSEESNYAPAGTPYVKHGNGYALKIEKYAWTLLLTQEDQSAEY